ncbi:Methyltransferase type 12 [Gemmatirosa kalamazoonensis]|uniref:Methyltransferase type 12 n=1 Tax=Gemmatirosa kalamazoonensis TaxID=861299 RepID=W0RBF2_9BACT|nr:class I SAM-dependent methyltransferase [Gemmatirosa kalamazoonensis]AHG88131.1 Methyltransferase type 12 [Gemmatirosa kalamazoonensis]
MDLHAHWDGIYRTKDLTELSWQQSDAALSLACIQEMAPDRTAAVIDVGGGASPLVDGLLAAGYRDVTVLDLAPSALARARERLGAEGAGQVAWLAADVCAAPLAPGRYDVWHDRAVFHFLTEAAERAAYVAQVRRAVRPGGLVLVATFAEDGPARCSGLPVARYSAAALHGAFGEDFALLRQLREVHHTPWGAPQPFTYCLCRYTPTADRAAA